MLLDLPRCFRVLLFLLQSLLCLQVLFAVIFIVILDVTEGEYSLNLIVAKMHRFFHLGITPLTMHVGNFG